MSHFTVLVIGDKPEEDLAPFQENNMEDCPKEYLEWTTNVKAEDVKEEAGRLTKTAIAGKDNWADKYNTKLMNKDYNGIIKSYYGGEKNSNGDWGYWSNPNSKWDWYVLGGRWTGYFIPKPGQTGAIGEPGSGGNKPITKNGVDQARKGDIDFLAMKNDSLKRAKKCYVDFQKKLKADPKCEKFNPYFEFGISNVGTKEKPKFETMQEHIREAMSWSTFAVIKDGKWYEQGQMGWWGMASNKKSHDNWQEEFEKLIEGLADDTLLSVYDCHI